MDTKEELNNANEKVKNYIKVIESYQKQIMRIQNERDAAVERLEVFMKIDEERLERNEVGKLRELLIVIRIALNENMCLKEMVERIDAALSIKDGEHGATE
jgi:hypothetical protein